LAVVQAEGVQGSERMKRTATAERRCRPIESPVSAAGAVAAARSAAEEWLQLSSAADGVASAEGPVHDN
jgi:hypothetical protein